MSDSVPKCPKCRKRDYDLTVTCEEMTFTTVTGGKFEFHGACSLPQPIRAAAVCRNCGHKWNIRNASTAQLNSYGA